MVTSTRLDTAISALGQNGPTSIKSPSTLTGISNEQPKSGGKTNQVIGPLSKNIVASLALSDSHCELASIDIAKQAVKGVASSLFEIKKVLDLAISQEQSIFEPEQIGHLKQHQRNITDALEAKFAGELVLDSTLAPQIQSNNQIQFRIEGLDFNRARWDDELVTLQLDGKMSLLMFEASKNDDELLKQFNKALRFSEMLVSKSSNNELILSMSDSKWRESNKMTHISGQGHRFPSGQAVPTNIAAVKGDISLLAQGPIVINHDTVHSVESFINEAKSSYQQLNTLRKNEVQSSASYLKQFHTESDPFEPKINTIIEEKKWSSLFNLKQNHATISRKTVIDLLK